MAFTGADRTEYDVVGRCLTNEEINIHIKLR